MPKKITSQYKTHLLESNTQCRYLYTGTSSGSRQATTDLSPSEFPKISPNISYVLSPVMIFC